MEQQSCTFLGQLKRPSLKVKCSCEAASCPTDQTHFEDSEIQDMSVTQLIFDKGNEALKCKKEGFSYELYVSYLHQFDYNGNKLVPVTETQYNTIGEKI